MARRTRGEGSVERLANGRFKVRLSYVDASGERHRPTRVFDSRSEATSWKNEQLAKIDKGETASAGRQTLEQWLKEWLALKKPQVEPNTFAPWDQHCRLHINPIIGRLPLGKLRPTHVSQLYSTLSDLGVSNALVRKIGTTLTMALKDAVRLQLLTSNPATAIRKPKSSRPEIHPLDPEQVRVFLGVVTGKRLEAMYVLALDSDMRQGELFRAPLAPDRLASRCSQRPLQSGRAGRAHASQGREVEGKQCAAFA